MFDFVNDMFGVVYVREEGDNIVIGGINTNKLLLDIQKIWGNSRIVMVMFTKINKSNVTFNRFFGVDVLYLFEQVWEFKKRVSNKYRCRQVVELLQSQTWLKTIDSPHDNILDMSKLTKLYHTPYVHQIGAINDYNTKVPKMGLNGFLLAAAPGAGKTIISLAIATCLDAEIVFVVAPKGLVDTVWTGDIRTEMGADTKIWSASDKVPLTEGYKYYVFNFEAIAKAFEFARKHSHLKTCVILDESHNLNEIKSERTNNFILFCKLLKCKNIIFSSGTPVKALGYEVIPLLRCIDPLFTPEAEELFKKIFGISSKRAVDILRHRIDLIGHKIPREVFMKVAPPIVKQLKVKIPNGKAYTIDVIKAEMKVYIAERIKFYNAHMKEYIAIYDKAIRTYADTVKTKEDQLEFKKYLEGIKSIRAGYDPKAHKDILPFCNNFETKKIAPVLSSQMKKDFKDARSVVKYVDLKVLGEALGNVLTKRRAECHRDMIAYSGLDEIARDADKKMLCFSDYVDVIKEADRYFRAAGFEPDMVYGETVKDITPIVNRFKSDPNINPLLATSKTMSAGVTLVNCSVIVLLNLPFRQYLHEQMIARIFRIGQDAQTYVYECILDTGAIPNVSSRSLDILEWSRDQVSLIMGKDMSTDAAVGIVMNLHMNGTTAFERALHMFRSILHIGG